MPIYAPHRLSQPQGGAQIAWGNPITEGLAFAVTPAHVGSFQRYNGVGDGPVDTLGQNALGDSAFTLAGSGSNHMLLDFAPAVRNYPLTFLAIARRAVAFADISLVSIGSGTQRHLLYINQNAPAMYSASGGPGVQAVGSASLLTTSPGPAVWVAGRVASATVREVWLNGRVVAGNNGSVVTTDSNVAAIGAYWNNDTPSLYWNGAIFLAAAWARVLSDDEMIALYENPWQLFAPRRIWVPQAAIAGLPTLSLPTYTPGSLTATGFRPRVTAT